MTNDGLDILARTRIEGEFFDVLDEKGLVYDYCCLVDYPCELHKNVELVIETKR